MSFKPIARVILTLCLLFSVLPLLAQDNKGLEGVKEVKGLMVYFEANADLDKRAQTTDTSVLKNIKLYLSEKTSSPSNDGQKQQGSLEAYSPSNLPSSNVQQDASKALVIKDSQGVYLINNEALKANSTSPAYGTQQAASASQSQTNSDLNSIDPRQISKVYLGKDGEVLVFPGGVLVCFEKDYDQQKARQFFIDEGIPASRFAQLGDKKLGCYKVTTYPSQAFNIAGRLAETKEVRKAFPNYLVDFKLK